MAEIKGWYVEQLDMPDGCNLILGHSHFIKTVEDLYEALVTASPTIQFGIAFCEASGPCLVRRDGNAPDLIDAAVANAMKLRAGHAFVVLIRNGYPINVLDRIRHVQEICRIDAATANPIQAILVETDQGRGVVGVVDGFESKGVETDEDVVKRSKLLREIIGYKR